MSAVKTPIMYVQRGWSSGRIGRVRLSKTGRTIHYGNLVLEAMSRPRCGYKANYMDATTRDEYWISGPRKDGQDTLYPGVVEIDADVLVEYWRDIRSLEVRAATFRSLGVHGRHATR
jgi:hypothetical protein